MIPIERWTPTSSKRLELEPYDPTIHTYSFSVATTSRSFEPFFAQLSQGRLERVVEEHAEAEIRVPA